MASNCLNGHHCVVVLRLLRLRGEPSRLLKPCAGRFHLGHGKVFEFLRTDQVPFTETSSGQASSTHATLQVRLASTKDLVWRVGALPDIVTYASACLEDKNCRRRDSFCSCLLLLRKPQAVTDFHGKSSSDVIGAPSFEAAPAAPPSFCLNRTGPFSGFFNSPSLSFGCVVLEGSLLGVVLKALKDNCPASSLCLRRPKLRHQLWGRCEHWNEPPNSGLKARSDVISEMVFRNQGCHKLMTLLGKGQWGVLPAYVQNQNSNVQGFSGIES